MANEDIYRRRFQDRGMRTDLWATLVEGFFQRYVAATDVVLDVPCGYGEFISNVRCARKIAVDVNAESALHVGPDVEFHRAPSTAMPIDDGTVDTAFVSNFFEHLTRDDIVATVGELARVLKPGGRVLVLQPNIRFAHRDYWMFFDHITPIDDRALEEVFALGGFSLEERILRFLPFTAQGRIPAKPALVRLYLRVPLAWRVLGRQSFLVFTR